MIVAWIVITLMLALVVGLIAWGVMHDEDGIFGFFWGFSVVCAISFWISVIFVAGHFIMKYW